MDEEMIIYLFNCYYRGMNIKDLFVGMGFGFVIVKEFVYLYNGMIYVNSRMNIGMVIIIFFKKL